MSPNPTAAPRRGSTRLFTIPQVADEAQVSVKTIRRRINAGDLIAHRIGKSLRITEDDFRAFLNKNRT